MRLKSLAGLLCALVFAAAMPQGAVAGETVAFRLGPVQVLGNAADALELGLGAFNITDRGRDDIAPAGRIEYRFGRKVVFVGPLLGLEASTEGALFGYVGAYVDIAIGRLTLTPTVGFGGYKRGGGRDLGQIFQFRSGGSIAYRLDSGVRVGLNFSHISNASTAERNPGQENLFLVVALPLGPVL